MYFNENQLIHGAVYHVICSQPALCYCNLQSKYLRTPTNHSRYVPSSHLPVLSRATVKLWKYSHTKTAQDIQQNYEWLRSYMLRAPYLNNIGRYFVLNNTTDKFTKWWKRNDGNTSFHHHVDLVKINEPIHLSPVGRFIVSFTQSISISNSVSLVTR